MLLPELTDIVIDFLFDDRDALDACALVSREWVPSAQYHIFSQINIRNVTKENQHNPSWVQEFVNFLNIHSHIQPLIRDLRVLCSPTDYHSSESIPSHATLDAATLVHICRMLPSLQNLVLDWVCLASDRKGFQVTTFPGGSRPIFLKSLSITNTKFKDSALRTIFEQIRVTDTLRLLDVTRGQNAPTDYPKWTMIGHPCMRSVTVELGEEHPPCIRLDQLAPSSCQLQVLDVAFADVDFVEEIGDTLTTKCEHLIRLRLDIHRCTLDVPDRWPGNRLPLPDNLSLYNCPNLQILEFKVFSSWDIHPRDTHFQWSSIIDILSTAPTSLREIAFGIRTVMDSDEEFLAENDLTTIRWDLLESVLLPLHNLKSVTFRNENIVESRYTSAECADPLTKDWTRIIERRLPTIHARGLLRLSF